MAVPPAFIGKTLAETELGRKYGVQVLAIKELVPERVHLIPPASQWLKDSDIIIATGSEQSLTRLGEV